VIGQYTWAVILIGQLGESLQVALVKKHPTLEGRCTYGRYSKEVDAVFIRALKFITCAGLVGNVM
jgi:hypothetical protein